MKTEINIIRENSKTGQRYEDTIIVNRHKLKLATGEIISVGTDKRGDCWFVSDIESGLNLIYSHYYGFIEFDPVHDVYSEKNALETAKFCIDRYLAENNITFAEWRTKRIKQLTHQHEDKGE